MTGNSRPCLVKVGVIGLTIVLMFFVMCVAPPAPNKDDPTPSPMVVVLPEIVGTLLADDAGTDTPAIVPTESPTATPTDSPSPSPSLSPSFTPSPTQPLPQVLPRAGG